MANSVDPDQIAPVGAAVWSGSALFTKAYLYENGIYVVFQPCGVSMTASWC